MKKLGFFILLCMFIAVSVSAQDSGGMSSDEIEGYLTTIWLVVCGALVFFMQAGFALVESGLTRAKNAGNIIMKNLMDFCIGSLMYWLIGWAFMYGNSAGGFIGLSDFLLSGEADTMRDWFFQVVFVGAAATIVSGAMAERTKFTSYIIYSIFVSGLIYPISGHWVWSGSGWLSGLGFHDFAGSMVVHGLGGFAALAGAIALGPRIGKYVKLPDGKTLVKPIIGHSLPLAALGVFILWFGWYGFNAGSTLSGATLDMAHVAATTTLSAAAGSIAAMITIWIASGKPDVSMTLNGALAGLVGITAPTAVVSPGAAIIIGLISGVIVVLSVELLDKKLHIDDPVGAVSVHGICGVWGVLAVGIFGNLEAIGSGLSRAQQIGVQALGALTIATWGFVLAFIIFTIVKKTVGLRVSEKEELAGLDVDEHGTEAYSGFQFFQNM